MANFSAVEKNAVVVKLAFFASSGVVQQYFSKDLANLRTLREQ